MTGLLAESQSILSADVDWAGLGDIGQFDSWDGGEGDSDLSRFKPAGLPEEVLTGTQTIGNITGERAVRRERDRPLIQALYDAPGRPPRPCRCSGTTGTRTRTAARSCYTAVLKTVTLPAGDSTSNDAAMMSVEFEVNGKVKA
jgi:hypothetical protein